jgi:ariadne-1
MAELDEDMQLAMAISASLEEYENQAKAKEKQSTPTQTSIPEKKHDTDVADEENDDETTLSSSSSINIRNSNTSLKQSRNSLRESSDLVHIDEADGFQFEEKDSEFKDKKPYQILSRDDIVTEQTAAINKVCDFLCLPFSSGRILLQMFHWDVEQLLERWAEDSKALCKKAGISPPEEGAQRDSNLKKSAGECTICSEDVKDLLILSCGHGFCSSCWKDYLKVAITEKKEQISCPAFKCQRTLDEFFVLQLVGDAETKKRFNENLVTSFVENNPFVKWCPAPNCHYAIWLKEFTTEHNEQVTCKCGYTFCFRCNEEGHQPALCSMYKDWKVKNAGGDEALNQKAIASFARPCPRCKIAIEKNGGCNHMTCHKCHFHFCWQCMQKFGSGEDGGTDGYRTHKCNGYYQEDKKIKEDHGDWERFRWYSERYNNHARSFNFEKKMFDDINVKRQEMVEEGHLSRKTTSFYLEAVTALLDARRAVMNSYIFGYYRPLHCPEIHKDLFEHRQNELERHTEMISRQIENKKAKELCQNRITIINVTKLVTISRRALLDVAVNAIDPKALPPKTTQHHITPTDSRSKRFTFKKGPGAQKEEKNIGHEMRPLFETTDEEDEELKTVLELSKVDTDEELKTVLELSKVETNARVTQEEHDIQEAIRRSLQETVQTQPKKPNTKKKNKIFKTKK